MRVLVAEDERITRATLVRQLDSLGHSVVAAEDGQAAWEAFSAGGTPFDLIVTDWEMPRTSGVELVKKVRGAATDAYVYIILLTSRSDKQDVVSGIEAGADDYVSKPFDKDELRARVLAGERVVRLERALKERNQALQSLTDRMQRDLRAAARVQKAMLPRAAIVTPRVRTSWRYVPTDELAGDALGFELIDDRHLVCYVLDVSGHGVPAALLSVTAMHALAPSGTALDAIRTALSRQEVGDAPLTAPVLADLNRRFSSTDNDGRFLTIALAVIDTHTGRVSFTRAAHPVPILVRSGACVPVDESGGMPLALYDTEEYADVHLRLQPGDRLVLYTDGVNEQLRRGGPVDEQFGVPRFEELLCRHAGRSGDDAIDASVAALTDWAGGPVFQDDVSLLVIDWLG